ncbi:MAG TPA: hypothetical protein VHX61_10925 [Rhizomicrobium sp.]|nr:hypothetical protein [Rhizomicrobium sp.]
MFPCRRFVPIARRIHARLGADVVRYSFTAADSHRLLLAVLPAHLTPILPLIGDLAVKRGWTLAAYEAAKEEASRLAPRIRRAEADARHLALLWQMVSKGPKNYSCE